MKEQWNSPQKGFILPHFFGALFCFLLALIFLQGCKHETEKNTVLAQVGNATLTLADLRESFPAEFEPIIRREQYLDFIKRWIDDEVLFQQAQKAELEKDSSVARKLAKVKRKLLIEEFLAKENSSEVFEPDEMTMNQYYEMHKDNFKRKTLEAKFMYLRVATQKQANELRTKISHSDFFSVAATNSLDPIPESEASIGFKKAADFPSCLSSEISKAGIGSVTAPIACSDGYYLLKVLERQEAGSLIPLPEAKEEINAILVMERKDKVLEDRVNKYKEGLAISYNLDQIPGQTEAAEPKPSAVETKATAASKPSATEPKPSAVKQPREPAKPAEPKAETAVDPTTLTATAPPLVHRTAAPRKKTPRHAAPARPTTNEDSSTKNPGVESETSIPPPSATTPAAPPAAEEEKSNAQ